MEPRKDQKHPARRHGSEKLDERNRDVDEAGMGRKGGADIDVAKRERELRK